MARRPEDRYATALELAADVSRWLADEKVQAHRESLGARLRRWRRRHPAAVAAAAVAVVCLVAGALGGFFLWQSAEQRRHETLADLRGSAEGNEELALAELHAGRFAHAEGILRQALHAIENEAALEPLRGRLAARLDRTHRLAQFYELTDEAERREAVQSTHKVYGESGSAAPGEAGLRQVGVFEEEEWWKHLPDADLTEAQRGELREEVYHQLILLAIIRAKRGGQLFPRPAAAPFFESGLEAVTAANRYRPDSYAARRLEAGLLFLLGRGDEIKPFAVQEPRTAADHYFLAMTELGIAIGFGLGDSGPVAQQLVFRQLVAMAGGDVQDPLGAAVTHFRLAADLRPRHYWAHCWLGYSLRRTGQFEAAELAYDTCIALRPEYLTGYHSRAATLLQQRARATDPRVRDRLLKRALADLTRAIDLDPHRARSRAYRGFAYLQSGEVDRALADFNEAIRLDPKDAEGFRGRAAAYGRKGDPDRGLADFAEAVRVDPDDPYVYNERAHVFFDRGDYARATADYTEAIRRDPTEPGFRRNRGWVRYLQGDTGGAVADYTEVIRLGAKDAEPFRGRGLAYAARKDHDRAIADFTRALQLAPDDAVTYANRAAAYEAKGDDARARADREKARQLDPKPGHYADRGAEAARGGRWAEAAAAFGQLTEMEPDNPTGWYHLAIAHLGGGDLPAYRRACATLMERFGATREPHVASTVLYACLPGPSAVAADDRLARLADIAAPHFRGNVRLAGAVAYRRGRYEEAVRHFDEAGKGFALRPWDWLFLAMAQQRLGHAGEARRLLARAAAWIDEADKSGARGKAGSETTWGGWFERVEVQSLRREAEALLGDAGPGGGK
jgi:tetratricopeptide (TPR) repeat protein